MKLEKNLYGLKQASHNSFEMIKKGLDQRRFSSSKADPCVFMKQDIIVLLYVDDMIVVNRTRTQIDHNQRGHWKIIDKCNMPSGTKPIMSIWSFKRKKIS